MVLRAQQSAQEEADRMLEDMTRAMDGDANEDMDMERDNERTTSGRTHVEPTTLIKKAWMEDGVDTTTKVRRDSVKQLSDMECE